MGMAGVGHTCAAHGAGRLHAALVNRPLCQRSSGRMNALVFGALALGMVLAIWGTLWLLVWLVDND